jgi:hypothetical protein
LRSEAGAGGRHTTVDYFHRNGTREDRAGKARLAENIKCRGFLKSRKQLALSAGLHL